jgi:hypothetical protein
VFSVEQNDSADQLNCGEEISGEFVVACGDAMKMLEFVEEVFAKTSVYPSPLEPIYCGKVGAKNFSLIDIISGYSVDSISERMAQIVG